MPDVSEAQVRLPISNYPIGTIISHHGVPDIRWRVIKHHRELEGGPITKVDIQKIGGDLNRGTVTLNADNDAYVAIGGRLRGRMRQRAMQQRRAAATPPETDAATTTQGKPRIKPVTKAVTPAAKKPKDKDAVRAAKPTGSRSKGVHARGKPTVPITSLKLDHRNPFDHGSRIHAYFQAFLEGKGKTTYGQMVACCLELGEKFGVEDSEEAIRRDLNNQTHQWRDGKWGLKVTRDDSKCQKGKGGRLAKGEHDNVVFTCVDVEGHPWDEHLASHRR